MALIRERVMNNERYLVHHSILGQKWGVRRYQNEDGSLTAAGKARYLTADGKLNDRGKKEISKQYKAEADKVTSDFSKNYQRMYVDSYNKAADKMNSGGIDKFNKQQQKKYGNNYAKRSGYVEDYNRYFEKHFANEYNKALKEFYSTNEHYVKTKNLLDRYGMETWDDLARTNSQTIKELFNS